ncbi:MAG: hypothetical protein ACXWDO_01830 [Bacteroidia bacterium]
MKKFRISTKINAPFETVWKGFDEKLFLALQPKFPETEILRFDGSDIGDKVQTNIVLPGIKLPFYAEIIAQKATDTEAFFIDKGTKLPFFLTFWQHKHIVTKITANTSQITDEIQFCSHNFFMEAFLYPVIYGQLWSRKSAYKKYFDVK